MGITRTMELYMVRHGVTEWNLEKRYQGHSDVPLFHEKIDQLLLLKRSLSGIKFDYCFSSDLRRCIETAEHIDSNKPVCIDQRVREMNFGDWEGLTYDGLKNDSHYQKWLTNWETDSPPNGESFDQFKDRIHHFFEDLSHLQKTDSTALLVTHGGVIRAYIQTFTQTNTFWDIKIEHGKAYRLSLQHERGRWVCNSWSEVAIQGKEN